MPPKGWKKYADGFRPATSAGTPAKARPTYSLDELLLPRSTVAKLAREALSNNVPLPKDGVTALMRSATVFISHLCNDANIVCQQSGRKTISASDIEQALQQEHFGAFVSSVRQEVEATVARVAEAKAARAAGKEADLEELSHDSETEEGAEDAKKLRLE